MDFTSHCETSQVASTTIVECFNPVDAQISLMLEAVVFVFAVMLFWAGLKKMLKL